MRSNTDQSITKFKMIPTQATPKVTMIVSRKSRSVDRAMLCLAHVLITVMLICKPTQSSTTNRSDLTGVLFSNAQYSSSGGGGNSLSNIGGSSAALVITAPCDFDRLRRCQQDTLRDMQLVVSSSASLESTDVQYSINSGPPYSPIQQQTKQLLAQRHQSNLSTCRLVRANLDCLLTTTPACYDAGIQAAQNTDIILRAKRFLEQNGCNGVDQSWQGTFCYRAPEVHNCEERYGLTSPYSTTTNHGRNLTACLAYNAFRYCLNSHLRLNCKVHEIDMLNEYLIDHAGDLAWRCPLNATTSTITTSGSLITNPNPYALSDSLTPLSPSSYSSNYGSAYEQRPTYVGSSGASLFSPSHTVQRDQPWERFRNQLLVDDTASQRYGISRQPGEVFDRLVVGSPSLGFDAETSDCPARAAPFVRDCEDTLMDQHRLARDSRDGNELQRRICCSLFQYRDCISRVVLDRCADSSHAAVEILMGARRREMTLTCRGFNRDVCSGALAIAARALSWPILTLVALLAPFLTAQLNLKTHSF